MFRRRKWTPPEHDPQEQEEARSAVAEAVQRLSSVMARQGEVDRAHCAQKKIRRENHMAPRIASALGARSE
ncbi:hypothetical protein AB0I37_24850 [Micromonospora purpureochromogenes]|uniref:DUF7620 family protein n=1 Tax=Micromonospora purpureochromogenes TaxID=47872 RepID=UPI0033E5E1D2